MTMTRLPQIVILTAAALALAGCVNPNTRNNNQTVPYTATPQNTQNGTVAAPYTTPVQNGTYNTTAPNATYYRGTENSAVVSNSDATINANVIAALSALPGMRTTNIQVTTYNGVVTLSGIADNKVLAQNAVQAARQVAGVRTVNYNLQLARP